MLRRCLREPIPAIYEAAAMLGSAASAHLAEDKETAAYLIKLTDRPEIAEWTESIWGRINPAIHSFRSLHASPPYLSPVARPRPRMPTRETQRIVVERDGYHCRFCGIPVIRREVRSALRPTYPEALRWGSRNSDQHAAFQCMWLQYDHVLPNQRGGDSSQSNVLITCAACNFGRMQWTVEESGLRDPRSSEGAPTWEGRQSWDGLERVLRPSVS